jgi:hypothetical protein
MNSEKISKIGARVGKIYPKPCVCNQNELCAPVEGHFVTECEMCDRFN